MNENMTLNQNTGMATQPMQPVQQPEQSVQNVAVAQPMAQPVAPTPMAQPAAPAPMVQPAAPSMPEEAPAAPSQIVNDVSIKVENADPNVVKKQIIVNGEDITYLPVEQLTEAIAEVKTDEQAEEYIKVFS